MREIKFRAWVRFMRKMGMVGKLNLESGSALVDIYPYEIESAAFDLMQYTGLKDKNGVEIYEGDIILINNSIIKEVKLEIHCVTSYGHGDSGFDVGLHIASGYGDSYEGCIEVIGSIHQNHELLDK